MASDKTQAPAVSAVLVEWLEEIFRDRCPERGMTMEDVWFAAGAASVVRKLRSVQNSQTKAALTGSP